MIYLGNQAVGILDKFASTAYEPWVKPADWPDIEQLVLDTASTMCIYFLYDCTMPLKKACVGGISSNYTLDYAKVQNGVIGGFDNTLTAGTVFDLPNDCNYIVVRYKSTNTTTRFYFVNSAANGLYSYSNNVGSNQTCVWIYGKLTPTASTDMYLNGSGGHTTIYAQRIKWIANDNITSWSYGWSACPNLRSLIIEPADETPFKANNFSINGSDWLDAEFGKCTFTGTPPVTKNAHSVVFKDCSNSSAVAFTIGTYSSLEEYVIHGNVKVSDMAQSIRYVSRLKKLDLSGLDLSACTNFTNFASNASGTVETMIWGTGTCAGINLANFVLLSHASLVDIINKLAAVETSKTLTIGNINLAKLSADEIAVATGKGWTLA